MEDGSVLLELSKTASSIVNPTFPKHITFDQANQMFGTRREFHNTLSTYSSLDVNSNFRSEYGYLKINTSYSTAICDHQIVNKWYEICGYPTDVNQEECRGNLSFFAFGNVPFALDYWEDYTWHLEYHMYSCSGCSNYIYTMNIRRGKEASGIQNIWIGEMTSNVKVILDAFLQSMSGKVETEAFPGDIWSQLYFLDLQNQLKNYLGKYGGLYPITGTYYEDKIGILKLPTDTYHTISLTRKMKNNLVNETPIPHKSLNIVSILGGNLVCNTIITRIDPTHDIQTIYQNNPILRTIVVSYLDGSAKIVAGTTDFSTSALGNGQNATITYDGKYSAKESKTFSTTVTIKIIQKSKLCDNGHTYRIDGTGRDPGCIYCKSWVRTLSVVNPSNKRLIMYRGQGFTDYEVNVLATYYDGRTEYLTTEFSHNLDRTYIGEQTVTIGYKGVYDTMKVEVKVNVRTCDICNRTYNLLPDDHDPGCPFCESLLPVFTGNVLEYYNEISKNEILAILYDKNEKLHLKQGDMITFHIVNGSKTTAMNLLDTIFGASHDIQASSTSKIRDTRY